MFCRKKEFLEISQNSQENICARASFLIEFQVGLELLKKEALAQVFSCEFCQISKNPFFTEHLCATASGLQKSTMGKKRAASNEGG